MRALSLLTVVAIAVMPLRSQSPATQKPSFDVASIKPNTQTNTGTGISVTPGRLHAENYTLKLLIQRAYDVQTFQIKGPGWIDSEHYDIEATSAGKESSELISGVMLQALLADRFALKFHSEKTEGTVLTLSVPKNGAKLKLSSCVQLDPNVPRSRPTPGDKPQNCGSVTEGGSPANWTLDALGMTMPELAKNLSLRLDRPVLDQTNLPGVFDIRLEYSRNLTALNDAPPELHSSVFAALQEQLGLRLASTKGPIELLVIDSVQKPTAN
jgi:uncharacterized protein (TIGR03435 family)